MLRSIQTKKYEFYSLERSTLDRGGCILGKIDTITKDYMKDNAVFADAFNYFIYDGNPVIQPGKLQELDTTEIAVPFGNGNEAAVQKYRDNLKAAALMADDKATYLVLGVENESDVKYAEPVKNGLDVHTGFENTEPRGGL